jgi:tetratricopeptide (TPR) repeat protein
LSLAYSFPAADLAPDYYNIGFSLIDEQGKTIDEKKANFIIALGQAVARPITIAKTFPLADAYLYFYTLAAQHDKSGESEKAEFFYQKCYEMAPDYKEGIVFHANFLIRNGKYEKALELAEKIAGEERLQFDYYLIKGRALTRLGRYAEAINQLLEANKIYNSDTRLLNALGLCFYRTGEKAKALDVLKASLQLNSEQPEIKKLVEEIQK